MLEISKKVRLVVGFVLTTKFNECVTMDLKQWPYQDKVWLIHIVDHLIRNSASCAIKSKRKEVIVESIVKIWRVIFGSSKSFLVDDGSEFNNSEFISFCENFNINIKTTSAESPWSSGWIEHHSGVLGNWYCLGCSSQEFPEEYVWIFSKSTSFWQKIQLP